MRQVCIDVGGTFTDCVVQDENNHLHIFKSSTTPGNPVNGVVNVLAKAAQGFQESLGAFLNSLGLLVHGTTLATNVLLTGRGARAGFITTEGFREVLPMRRGIKHRNRSMFDQFQEPYRPLIDRSRILGVPERMSYTGEARIALDEAAVARAAEQLVADDCTSIAIGFLHSYANSAHEDRAREIVAEAFPDVHVVDVARRPARVARVRTVLDHRRQRLHRPHGSAVPSRPRADTARTGSDRAATDHARQRADADHRRVRRQGRAPDHLGTGGSAVRGPRRRRAARRTVTSSRSTWAARASTCA